jgi:hypothetical protein
MTHFKIELITEIGTFKFEQHFNSEADHYQAMLLFQSNNWEQLGETSYRVHTRWPDEMVTSTTFSGINASAHLAEYMEPDGEFEEEPQEPEEPRSEASLLAQVCTIYTRVSGLMDNLSDNEVYTTVLAASEEYFDRPVEDWERAIVRKALEFIGYNFKGLGDLPHGTFVYVPSLEGEDTLTWEEVMVWKEQGGLYLSSHGERVDADPESQDFIESTGYNRRAYSSLVG